MKKIITLLIVVLSISANAQVVKRLYFNEVTSLSVTPTAGELCFYNDTMKYYDGTVWQNLFTSLSFPDTITKIATKTDVANATPDSSIYKTTYSFKTDTTDKWLSKAGTASNSNLLQGKDSIYIKENWGGTVVDTTKTVASGHYGTQYDLSLKVDKVSGKELSTNDLTNNLKNQYDKAFPDTSSTWNDTVKCNIGIRKFNNYSLTGNITFQIKPVTAYSGYVEYRQISSNGTYTWNLTKLTEAGGSIAADNTNGVINYYIIWYLGGNKFFYKRYY
jgi:hypothetical protein